MFTTVSEVTAFEAEKLLGRKPDAILPNGLNIQRFAALHEFQNLHRAVQGADPRVRDGALLPQLHVRPRQHALLLHRGRYEYRNKGWTCSSRRCTG